MTWKPTDEMKEIVTNEVRFGLPIDKYSTAVLIAVQPLIAKEERERIAKEFDGYDDGIAANIRTL